MKNIFTKNWIIWTLGMVVLMFGMAGRASAQDTKNDLLDNFGATAMCRDAAGNVYVIRDVSAFVDETQGTDELVEYPIAGGSPVVLKSNIGLNQGTSGGFTSPTGLAIASNGDIYMTAYDDGVNSSGNVMKLTKASNYATETTFYVALSSSYGYFYGLAIDSHDNLYVTGYDISGNGGNGTFDIFKFSSVSSAGGSYSGNPTIVNSHIGDAEQSGFNANNSAEYVPINAIVIDGSDNIYVAEPYAFLGTAGYDGGSLVKLSATGPGTYGSSAASLVTLKSSFYGSALGFDPSGNLFAIVITNPASSMLVYQLDNLGLGGANAGSPTVVYSGLGGGIEIEPWGIAAINSTDIYVINGEVSGSGQQGDIYQLFGTPGTQASGVGAAAITEKTATISWTIGSGTSRAVFVALTSAGSISLSNGTTYNASTSLGSGSPAGTGWSCVYNGTGNSVSISNLTASSNYKMMVVEFNGSTGTQNYNTNPSTNNPNTFSTVANPSLTASGGSDSYSTGGAAVTVDAGITASAGQTNLSTATINVSSNFSSGDALNFTTQNGITGAYTSATGVLTLSGSSLVANYQTALRSITFSSSSGSTATRTISFVVGDGTANSSTVTKTITVTASTTISSLTAASTFTNGSTVNYTATFAASITGLSASDFTVTPGGSVSGATVGTVSGSGTTWTVPVNTGSGDGTVQLAMNGSGGVTPTISNATAGSPFTGTTVTVDKTAPTVSIAAPSANYANSSTPITWSVSWSDANLNTSSITPSGIGTHVNKTGTANFTSLNALPGAGGNPTTIQMTGLTGDGTIGFTVPAGSATDNAGNSATASSPSATVIIDNTAPTISIGAPSLSATNGGPVSFIVTYGDANFNSSTLTSGNITLNKTSTANASSIVVSGSGTTRTVTLSGITGDGALGISIASGTATDLASNSAPASSASTTFTVDNTAPTVSIGAPSVTIANSSTSIDYTVTWNDANLNNSSISLTASNVLANLTKTGTVSLVSIQTDAPVGNTEVVHIKMNGDGTVAFTVPAGTATDNAGNAASASSLSTAVTIDNTAPTVVSIAAQDPTPTNETQLDYTVTFSEPVTGVDPTDFTATTSGVSGGTISVTPLSATVYNISLSPVSGNGTLRLDLNSSGTGIADLAGNAISGGFTGGDTYTVDQTAPTVQSITATTPSNTNPTNSTTLAYTVTFSEAVTGVNQSAFAGNNLTGTVSYSSITVSPVSSSVYTVTLNGISGDGTMRLDLNSSGTGIADLVGNAISGGFTGGDVYTIDNTPPTLTSLVYSTSNANIGFAKTGDVITLTFGATEAIQTPSVTIAGHSITATNTGGNNYSAAYTMTGGDTEGRIPFNLTVTDLAGNSGNYNDVASGDDIEFDMTAPTVLIGTPSASQIATGTAGTVTYTVTYADANFNTSALTTGGITLNTSGSANGSVAVSGSGTSYTVTISSITGIGSLGITVAGGNASDLAGNTDAGAGPSTPFMVVSSDATLASLSLSSGTLSPAFNSSVTSYTANVPYSVSNISVSATPNDINASSVTIQVNGNPAPGLAPLNVGANTVLVTVIAQDGTTTKNYTVTVNRGMSVNANLARLTLTRGVSVPGFAPSITSYTVTVASNVTSEVITPTVSDANATLTLNGSPLTSGTPATVNLAMGSNPVTIVVTAQNGSTKTYTVTINRVLSSDSYLSNLAVRDNDKVNADLVPLSPGFNYLTMAYTATVPNSQTTVTVKPTSIDPAATITVNGTPVTTKTFSNPIAVNVGLNTITIIVKSPDNTTTQTYTIGVTRAASPNAYLSNLVVNTAALSPAFVFNTLTYTADVPNATGSVTVKANVLQAGATFTVNGITEQPQVASDPINLAVGGNTITVIVTAPDNTTTQTYTVTVTRDPGSSNTVYQPVGVTKPTESFAVAEDGIKVHQGISPNGDGIEDFLQIDNISQYPDNKLAIMNRNGQLVYEAKGYDNSSKTFDGHSNKNGQMQLPGTYFYSLDYTVNGVAKHKTGFIVLKY